MMIKKRYVVISFLAFCLTATLFIGLATSGKKPNPVWTAIYELQTKVDTLNASNLDLLNRVEMLENQILPQGFVSAPAYDSGWGNLSHGMTTFTHNLGTTEVFVYMIGKDIEGYPLYVGIHQFDYGGNRFYDTRYRHFGAVWRNLTNTTIEIRRFDNDVNWEQVRIMIWKISEPPI